jgi:hypothetical protein
MSKPEGNPGKLPVPVTALVRSSVAEFSTPVIDCSPLGIELLSPRRLADSERVGLTLKCAAVRGPGVSIHGDVQTCREEAAGQYFVRIVFDPSGEAEKSLQNFLWEVEEAGRKRRRR